MNTMITAFTYCLGTSNGEPGNNMIDVSGVLPAITPEYIPGSFSFSIMIGLSGLDTGKQHTMSIVFGKGNEKPLVNTPEVTIPVQESNQTNLPGEAQGFVLSMDLKNVVFEEEGIYSTKVRVDNQELGEYKIYVAGKRKTKR